MNSKTWTTKNYLGKIILMNLLRQKLKGGWKHSRRRGAMIDTPIFSRCSLGKNRWFWVVYRSWEAMYEGEEALATGYALTAQEAEQAALAISPDAKNYRAGMAASHHRDLCNRRRAAKPSSSSTTASALEFLYRDWMGDCD